MLSQLRHQRRFDGNPFFQQVEHDFADGVDLIPVGMPQHVLSLVTVGLTKNGLDEG